MYKVLLIHLLSCVLFINSALAVTGTAVSSGSWTNTSTWIFNGINRVPGCGDTIIIPAGITVTVNTQVVLSSCVVVNYVHVYGNLAFTNGNKLDLACYSTVQIHAGGLIYKSTSGGGNSTLISICGLVEWAAGDGPLPGPAILGGGSPLPVSLLSFTGNCSGDNVELKWATSSENNSDYFTIERSADGRDFTCIGKVKAAGTSGNIRTYKLVDKQNNGGYYFYRLCQYDFNGTKYDYGLTTAGNCKNIDTEFLIYGSNGILSVINKTNEDQNIQIEVTDVIGRKLEVLNNQLSTPGINSYQLSLPANDSRQIKLVRVTCNYRCYTLKLLQ